jgi:hypothetical protein
MTNVWSGLDGLPLPSVIFAWINARVSAWTAMNFFTDALNWANAGKAGSNNRNIKAVK